MPGEGAGGVRSLLALDIGGTHSRAQFAHTAEDGRLPAGLRSRPDIERDVSSAEDLAAFVRDVMERAEEPPSAVVAAFAGPIEKGPAVTLTNWREPRRVTLQALVRAGLPEGRVEMLNDLQAGAYGLLRALEAGPPDAFTPLHAPGGARPPDPAMATGCYVYVQPGTGLGAAALVPCAGADAGASRPAGDPAETNRGIRGGRAYEAVGCEFQHTPVPPFSGEAALAADGLRGPTGDGSADWEDLACGRGLPRVYAVMAASEGGSHRRLLDAGEIAEAALSGTDAVAERALALYYRTLGRFLQLMALAFRPCAAAFLGGASVEHDAAFVERSGLVEEYLANSQVGRLAQETPLFGVRGDHNLVGALARAACMPVHGQRAGV